MPDQYDDDDDLEVDSESVREESELRDLESRLQRMKQPTQGDRVFVKGVALATSMGFVLAGCLGGGFFAGDYLAKRFDQPIFLLLGILLGLVIAFVAVSKLLAPFLSQDE